MIKIKALTGAEAVAEAMRQLNPDVVAAFPITPQTSIMEKFSEYVADGIVDTELIRVESEHSALSAVVGAAAAGARTMTATSSAGLALMWEILGVASGCRLPIVMNVVNRALSAPINIHCDHSDSMGCRDHGWIQIYSENAQEVYENTIFGVRLAESVLLPVMVMQDGFIISHGLENVRVYNDRLIKNFVKKKRIAYSLLEKPITIGPLQLQDYYFETKRQQAEAMIKAKQAYLEIGKEFSKITGNKYYYFERYKLEDAKAAIVVLGSTAGTIKHVIDKLRNKGKKVGLLKIKLFRPFPYREVAKALKDISGIAVFDRSESYGAYPPVYSEIRNALYGYTKKLYSCIYGLGGREIYEADIEDVYNKLLSNKLNEKNYIGCRE